MSAAAFAHALDISDPRDTSGRGSTFDRPLRRAPSCLPTLISYDDLFDLEVVHAINVPHCREVVGRAYPPVDGWIELRSTPMTRPTVSKIIAAGSLAIGSFVGVAPAVANGYVGIAHPAGAVISPARTGHQTSISAQLERLSDGWAGAGSSAPTEQTIADVASASLAFDRVIVEAAIEVDDDGTVALEWFSENEVLCLTFIGDGTVVGTISPRTADYPGWKIEARDELALADHLSDERVKGFVRPA